VVQVLDILVRDAATSKGHIVHGTHRTRDTLYRDGNVQAFTLDTLYHVIGTALNVVKESERVLCSSRDGVHLQ
jgi:hypothetical protein